MKTIRRLVAVVVLLSSYHLSMAQDNAIPEFKSDTEKQAWINANPEQYQAALPQHEAVKKDVNVRSNERFANEAEKKAYLQENTIPNFSSSEEKQAWIDANPEKYEALNSSNSKMKPATQFHENKERFSSEEEKKEWLRNNK